MLFGISAEPVLQMLLCVSAEPIQQMLFCISAEPVQQILLCINAEPVQQMLFCISAEPVQQESLFLKKENLLNFSYKSDHLVLTLDILIMFNNWINPETRNRNDWNTATWIEFTQ